jgi:hypothetical protein
MGSGHMPEHWPHFGSDRSTSESEATGSSSTDGSAPDDGPVATDTGADPGPDLGTEVSGTVDAAAAEESTTGASADDATGDTSSGDASPGGNETALFLTELLRAMQSTVGIERTKMVEEIDRRRQAHIDGVRAREAAEADRMRQLADEDMSTIEAWADGEIKRIQLERERRAADLHNDLETSLSLHHSKIDRQLEDVESVIGSYRSQVDAFFATLDHEADLILIARHAANRPVFPDLESVAQTASAADATPVESPTIEAPSGDEGAASAEPVEPAATAEPVEPAASAEPFEPVAPAEPAVVGVMDPEAAPEPVESWAAPAESDVGRVETGETGEADQVGEHRDEPRPVSAVASTNPPGSLLASVPVSRPMSWLRRDASGGDRTNTES